MSVFPTAKHLCSWAGLTPQNNKSAGKKKSVRISKASCYLKPLLVQCTTAVVKSKKTKIRNLYLNIKKTQRLQKKAVITICRMLLTAIYNILKTDCLTIRNFTENLKRYQHLVKLLLNRQLF